MEGVCVVVCGGGVGSGTRGKCVCSVCGVGTRGKCVCSVCVGVWGWGREGSVCVRGMDVCVCGVWSEFERDVCVFDVCRCVGLGRRGVCVCSGCVGVCVCVCVCVL